jgi:hypothetical protein
MGGIGLLETTEPFVLKTENGVLNLDPGRRSDKIFGMKKRNGFG